MTFIVIFGHKKLNDIPLCWTRHLWYMKLVYSVNRSHWERNSTNIIITYIICIHTSFTWTSIHVQNTNYYSCTFDNPYTLFCYKVCFCVMYIITILCSRIQWAVFMIFFNICWRWVWLILPLKETIPANCQSQWMIIII